MRARTWREISKEFHDEQFHRQDAWDREQAMLPENEQAPDSWPFHLAICRKLWQEWMHADRLGDLLEIAIREFDGMDPVAEIDDLAGALQVAGRLDELLLLRKSRASTVRRLSLLGAKEDGGDEWLRQRMAMERAFLVDALRRHAEALDLVGDAATAERLREDADLAAAGKRRAPISPTDGRPMSNEVFWDLVENCHEPASTLEDQLVSVIQALSRLRPAEIRRFQSILEDHLARAATWDLWALAYIALGGCSDDSFLDFRGYLVTRGRDAFERALVDLAAAADLVEAADEPLCEGILSVADAAYDLCTGACMPPVRTRKERITGPEWDEDELETRYPELCRRFGFGSRPT